MLWNIKKWLLLRETASFFTPHMVVSVIFIGESLLSVYSIIVVSEGTGGIEPVVSTGVVVIVSCAQYVFHEIVFNG